MKTNSAEIIKAMRKEMGLSQEEMAEQLFISVRQLARIEAGEAGMDVWQFITTLELLGAPSEDFWLLYLDSGEYASYREYKRLKRRLNDNNTSGIIKIIEDIENGLLIRQPIVMQFVQYARAVASKAKPSKKMMDNLYQAMFMSKPSFCLEKISEYRMTYNEILIALSMAQCLTGLEEHDNAVQMVKSMIENREGAKVSEEDRAVIFPALYYTLSYILRKADRYKEAINACNAAIDICREYNNLKNIPEMLFWMAGCYHNLGEEEHICKTHMVRAYHMAYAIGKNNTAAVIKKDALRFYDIVIP